jgi:hypothetical protein
MHEAYPNTQYTVASQPQYGTPVIGGYQVEGTTLMTRPVASAWKPD